MDTTIHTLESAMVVIIAFGNERVLTRGETILLQQARDLVLRRKEQIYRHAVTNGHIPT